MEGESVTVIALGLQIAPQVLFARLHPHFLQHLTPRSYPSFIILYLSAAYSPSSCGCRTLRVDKALLHKPWIASAFSPLAIPHWAWEREKKHFNHP